MLSDYYNQGLALAQAGRFREAIQSLDAYLQERPTNGRCWNDAGAVLFRLGRVDDAIRYFLRSVDLMDHPSGVYKNLINSYLSKAQPAAAMKWLEPMRIAGHLDENVVQQVACGFTEQADWASAMEVLQCGRAGLEQYALLDQQIEAVKSKRAKIAFFCGGDGPTFLNDIIDYVRQRHPVRYFEGKTTQDVHDLMQWSDISWFEWCTDLARIGTNLPKVCTNIIRLHRYEAYMPWPESINWQHVDQLITVGNEWVLKALDRHTPDIRQKTPVVTIPNGVDLNRIEFRQRGRGKKIAFVASLRMVKNPMLLIQCMAELLKLDPDYTLYIAGKSDDLLLEQYFEHITTQMRISDAIVFDGFQTDIPGWLADKNYIVSTSVIESQGMGILEAMAAGIKPLVHNFPGAESTFGADCLFNTPQEFARMVTEDSYESEIYRRFVERRYSLAQQLRKINEVLAKFESETNFSPVNMDPNQGLLQPV
ncbi:MAG: glycosyltransferase [Planctomycetota bacterium]|jgi:tetratricopeptide (TPR) repeat protein